MYLRSNTFYPITNNRHTPVLALHGSLNNESAFGDEVHAVFLVGFREEDDFESAVKILESEKLHELPFTRFRPPGDDVPAGKGDLLV